MKIRKYFVPVLPIILLASGFLLSCHQVSERNTVADKFRLVWNDDPTSTMTIIWNQSPGEVATVYYDKKDHGLQYWKYANKKTTDRKLLNFYKMNTCYTKLTNLEPDKTYYFVVKDSAGVSERFYFRTASDKPEPFTFIAGGDTKSSGTALAAGRASNKMVAKLRPLFVLFDGDFTSGNGTNPARWHQWLSDWDSLTTTADGRKIPIITVQGNHENGDKTLLTKIFDVPFQQGDSSNVYYSLSFGGRLFHIIVLNSMVDPGGEQRKWLQADLAAYKDFTFKMAAYHKPFRPHTRHKRENDDEVEQWAGLFYRYGLDLSLEADSHMHKITYPVKPSTGKDSYEGFVRDDEKGTMFIGEGSWGAHPRANDDDKPWTYQSGSFNQIKWIHVLPKEGKKPAGMEIFTVITCRYDKEDKPHFYVDGVENLTEENLFHIPDNIHLFMGKDSLKSVKNPFYLNGQNSSR